MTTSGTFYHKDYRGGALVPMPLCRIGHASKFQVYCFKKSCENLHKRYVFFKIGIHYTQRRKTTTGYDVTRKRSLKMLKPTGNRVKKTSVSKFYPESHLHHTSKESTLQADNSEV